MKFTGSHILIIMLGYLVAIVLGHFVVGSIITRLWKQHIPHEVNRNMPLPRLVGGLDIFLYMSSFLLGFPEFIAIWLALKFAGEWSPAKTEIDRPLHHVFLLGNGLNVIIAVGSAIIIKTLIAL